MRIALITSTFPFGGGGTFFAAEVRQLLRSGQTVRVYPIRPRGALGDPDWTDIREAAVARPFLGGEVLASALLAAVGSPHRAARSLLSTTVGSEPNRALKNLAAFPKILALCRDLASFRPDHIHALWATVPATAARITGKWLDVPWSFTAHRWDITENNGLATKLAEASFIRFISQSGIRLAGETTGQAPDRRWWLSRLGVDVPSVSEPTAPQDPPVVLCPARLVSLKGHATLLEAIGLLCSAGKPVRLWLAGEGEIRGELEARVQALGLGEYVEFLGQVAHDELLALYRDRRVDLVVLGSKIEGIPISLMEAMAHAVPVVATDVGGVSEMITSDRIGTLVPYGNAARLRDALLEVLSDAERWARTARAGRARIREAFDVVDSAGRLSERIADCRTTETPRVEGTG